MYERTPALPAAEQQQQQEQPKATGTKPTTKAKQQNYIFLILSKLISMETYWVFACAFPFVLVGRLEKTVLREADGHAKSKTHTSSRSRSCTSTSPSSLTRSWQALPGAGRPRLYTLSGAKSRISLH